MQFATLTQGLPPVRFTEFRILPAGVFRSSDGSERPKGLPGWTMNARTANAVLARRSGRDDILIDYEHQSLLAEKNGKPAPAAGWFRDMAWREGQGLFAVNVRWTETAAAMIGRGEYRYISPVFSFDQRTGEVMDVVSIGLTNTPALSRLTDLTAGTAQLIAENEAMSASACGRQRDSDRAIYAFNRAFCGFGLLHPDTSSEQRAALAAYMPGGNVAPAKAKLSGVSPNDAAKLRHIFPGVFED